MTYSEIFKIFKTRAGRPRGPYFVHDFSETEKICFSFCEEDVPQNDFKTHVFFENFFKK